MCIRDRFRVDITADSWDDISRKWAEKSESVHRMHEMFSQFVQGTNEITTADEMQIVKDTMNRFRRLNNQYQNFYTLLQASHVANNPSIMLHGDDEPEDGKKPDAYMECYSYIKACLYNFGYRHEAGSALLLRQKQISVNGRMINTRFFEPCPNPDADSETPDPHYYLKQFIHHQFGLHILHAAFPSDPEKVHMMYREFVKGVGTRDSFENLLVRTNEFQFPVASPNRLLFSFKLSLIHI